MFPTIVVEMFGLDAKSNYKLVLEFPCMDGCVYQFANSKWTKMEKSDDYEAVMTSIPSWTHPHSPKTGEFWLNDPVSFEKAKLTNDPKSGKDHVRFQHMNSNPCVSL